MKVVLKGISQDVDLENPKVMQNFLVHVDTETGREFRVPVDEETVKKLLAWVGSHSPAASPEPEGPPTEDDLEGATEFSAEGEEPENEGLISEELEVPEDEMPPEDEEGPGSEDEVKSL